MGGIVALSIILESDVSSMRFHNGKCVLMIQGEGTPQSVYFTPGSLSVKTENIDNAYNINISFLSPRDRVALLDSALPYIGKRVILLVTFSTGEIKIYGSKECPLVLSFNPTPQSVPADYNGMAFLAMGVDFSPGRYGSYVNVEAVDNTTDTFTEFPPGYRLSSSVYYQPGTPIVDFENTPIDIFENTLRMQISDEPSLYSKCTFRRFFENQVKISKLVVNIQSFSNNGWFNGIFNYGYLYVFRLRDMAGNYSTVDMDFYPAIGNIEIQVDPTLDTFGYGILLTRGFGQEPAASTPHFIRLNSVHWE
jgi:hypothetical protein